MVLGSNEIKNELPVIHVGFTVQEGTTFKWNHFLDIIFRHGVCWAITHLKHEQILMVLSYTFQISQSISAFEGLNLSFFSCSSQLRSLSRTVEADVLDGMEFDVPSLGLMSHDAFIQACCAISDVDNPKLLDMEFVGSVLLSAAECLEKLYQLWKRSRGWVSWWSCKNVSNRGDGNTWIKLHISQFVYWGKPQTQAWLLFRKQEHTHKPICLILADHNDVVVTTYLVSIPHSGLFWHHVPICPRVDGPLNSLGVSMGSWILWSSSRFSTSSASQRRSFARVWYGFGMFVAKWSARCCQTWKIITYV